MLVAVLTAAFGLASCGGGGSASSVGENGKVTIGLSVPGPAFANYYVADSLGYFKDEGIDVDLRIFQSGSALQAGIVSGDVQVAGIGMPSVVSADVAGSDLKMVMSFQSNIGYDVMSASEISDWQDLKGKPVGISSPGGQTDFIMQMLLEQNGLDPKKDVTILGVGNETGRAAALSARKVAATLTNPGYVERTRQPGTKVFAKADDIDVPFQSNGAAVTTKVLEEKPELVAKVVRASIRAAAAMHDPALEDQVKDALAKAFKIDDQAELKGVYDYLSGGGPNAYPIDGHINVEGTKEILEFAARDDPRAAKLTVDDVVDDSVLQQQQDYIKKLEQKVKG